MAQHQLLDLRSVRWSTYKSSVILNIITSFPIIRKVFLDISSKASSESSCLKWIKYLTTKLNLYIWHLNRVETFFHFDLFRVWYPVPIRKIYTYADPWCCYLSEQILTDKPVFNQSPWGLIRRNSYFYKSY